ncbi:MAG: hypothetical protein LQ347_005889 [Umbilicaria vellea]|nr:MAG: hypothetical protein LQ347_005889 [Umbilicaria vellea]
MAFEMTPMNYLVQITVIGTSNPAVIRLLSIPVTATFEALHHAIEASLGWCRHEYDVGLYCFKVVGGDASTRDRKVLTEGEILLAIHEWDRDDCGYKFEGDASIVQLHEVFDSYEYREQSLQHVYNSILEGPLNALQVLGRTTNAGGRKPVCLGGQGETSIRAWAKSEALGKATPSTWDLDLDKVNQRMADLED